MISKVIIDHSGIVVVYPWQVHVESNQPWESSRRESCEELKAINE
jgi:hypothetical protein